MITLDKIQTSIVESEAKNIIVAAGAGSGKTRVLTERVKRLLQSGVNPRSVVIITFTNMAAEELYERLADVPNIKQCFIGTIHAFAKQMLMLSGTNFEIFSEFHQMEYMKYIIPQYAKYCTLSDYDQYVKYCKLAASGKMYKSDIESRFSVKVYEELCILLHNSASSILNIEDYPITVPILCKRNNVITFDELIKQSAKYFDKTHTSVDYLFVDELQDIGYIEYDFLTALKAKHNFFIGDDYQAIYGFKGGDVNIFLSLMNSPDWTAYLMTNNYRNGVKILDVANTVINKADDILDKNSHSCVPYEGAVTFRSQVGIDNFLKTFDINSDNYSDWFVLTRTNKHLNKLAKLLEHYHIPFTCFRKSELTKKQLDDAMKSNTVKLLTIHTSKGLESDNVVLYGDFKLSGTMSSDETKVFYVGITRARKQLYIFN